MEATAGHPFWVVSGESLALRPAAHELGTPISRVGRWVESNDLRVGDKLLARDGSQIGVTAIRTRTTQEWVYNLTVRRTHTYSVGSVGVLVHNRCPEFPSGELTESGFLDAAEKYLGEGYKDLGKGRLVSADGLRQVRYGPDEVQDLAKNHHAHFEVYDKSVFEGGKLTENAAVKIVAD